MLLRCTTDLLVEHLTKRFRIENYILLESHSAWENPSQVQNERNQTSSAYSTGDTQTWDPSGKGPLLTGQDSEDETEQGFLLEPNNYLPLNKEHAPDHHSHSYKQDEYRQERCRQDGHEDQPRSDWDMLPLAPGTAQLQGLARNSLQARHEEYAQPVAEELRCNPEVVAHSGHAAAMAEPLQAYTTGWAMNAWDLRDRLVQCRFGYVQTHLVVGWPLRAKHFRFSEDKKGNSMSTLTSDKYLYSGNETSQGKMFHCCDSVIISIAAVWIKIVGHS